MQQAPMKFVGSEQHTGGDSGLSPYSISQFVKIGVQRDHAP
jgi:hypothetical protein